MASEHLAKSDFERAFNRAVWRRILNWLKGSDNQLLPYDEVRARLPIRGQHYLGLMQVPTEKIVGSVGRYNDFDRAFLPTQRHTQSRWISIDKAHYEDVILPPVELFLIGEIYFVKDGNHRVSVARERGQVDIDAYVTQIDIPIRLAPDININDLELKKAQAEFLLQSHLNEIRPAAQVEPSVPELYQNLLEHISTHRWYLGVERKAEVPYPEAVASWYDNVYLPVVQIIREQDLLKSFTRYSESDLYIWIMEYQAFLRQAYSTEDSSEDQAKAIAAQQLVDNFPQPAVSKLIQVVNRTTWLDEMILKQERANFFEQSNILGLRPEAQLETSLPGQYDRLLNHITVHRWYLGEQRKTEVPNEDAVKSWYDNVYKPIIEIIREHDILSAFPGRTETDLYLWIVKHRWYLHELWGTEVPIEQAANNFAEEHSPRRPTRRPRRTN